MSFVSDAISRFESAPCASSRPPCPGASTIQAAALGTGGPPASAPWTGIRRTSRAMAATRTGRHYSGAG